jgi:hypothetical protein
VVALAGRPLATDDTWWHLAMGALYAGGDLWPREDPLLHTTVLRAPVPHEWLFQVALRWVEQGFGFTGLRILHVALVGAIGALAFALLQRAGRDRVAAAAACTALLVLAWFRFVQLRPELVSAIALLAVYALVLRDAGPPRAWRIAAALAVVLAWVNAHSLFAIGLCLALAALLGTLLEAALARVVGVAPAERERNAERGRRLLLFLALAIALTSLNPRGYEQHLTFVGESHAGLIWKIRDDFLSYHPFAPPHGAGPAFTLLAWGVANLVYAAFLIDASLRLIRLARRRTAAAVEAFDAVHFGLAAAALAASLVAVRFHWLAVFPLLYLLRPLAARPMPPGARAAVAAAALAIAAALPGSAGAPALAAEVAREKAGYWRSPWLDARYCGPGTRFLADAGLEGRLFNPFNLGGFLGYWLAPRMRTFIDGRLDHVPAEVLDTYLSLRRTSRIGPTPPLRRRLRRWGIDVFFADTFPHAWYADRESGYHLRRLPEWMPIFVARTHAVYLRRNPRNGVNLERVAAYWAARGVPFDRTRGFEVERVIHDAPALAAELELVLPGEAALDRGIAGADRAARARALESLAAHTWRVGRFTRQVELDAAIHAERPQAREPALRLSDGLLALGRVDAAIAVLEPLARSRPEDDEVADLVKLARERARPGG